MVTSHGIEVDVAKLKTITKIVTEIVSTGGVRSFLGSLGYCRRFIEGFSKIARPMTRLTRKEVKFNLSNKCE